MADTFKVLGQAQGGAGVQTTLYTVPGATATVASVCYICNQGAATTVRLRVNIAGAGDANQQFILYDTPLAANTTMEILRGLALATTDVVKCQSASGNVSFTLYGDEIT